MPSRLDQKTRRVWAIFCLSGKKVSRIGGAQLELQSLRKKLLK